MIQLADRSHLFQSLNLEQLPPLIVTSPKLPRLLLQICEV